MKKTVLAASIGLVTFSGIFFVSAQSVAHAQGVSIQQLIQIFISLGIIPADKVATVEAIFGMVNTTGTSSATSTTATSTQTTTTYYTPPITSKYPIPITFATSTVSIPTITGGSNWKYPSPTNVVTIDGSGFGSDSVVNVSQNGQLLGKIYPKDMIHLMPTEIQFTADKILSLVQKQGPAVYQLNVSDAQGSSIYSISFNLNPKIITINPASSALGGMVTLFGTNFDSRSIVEIGDNGPTITPTQFTSTSLSFVVPNNITSGTYNIHIFENAQGLSNSNSVNFTITAPQTTTTTPVAGCTPGEGYSSTTGAACGTSTQTTPTTTSGSSPTVNLLISLGIIDSAHAVAAQNAASGSSYLTPSQLVNLFISLGIIPSQLAAQANAAVGTNQSSGTPQYTTTTTASPTSQTPQYTTTTTQPPTPAPVTTTPLTDIGLVNPGAVTVTATAGQSTNAFTLHSTTAHSFYFYGYPTSYGPGINIAESSGGISAGGQTNIMLQVNSNVPSGTYTGTVHLRTSDTGVTGEVTFPMTVNIVAP